MPPRDRPPLSPHSDEFRLIRDAFAGCEAIGDDAAVLPSGLLLATDTLLEGRHFLPDADPELVGRKAVAVNLSDIAAMGGQPTAITIALTVGRGWDESRLSALLRGARSIAEEYDAAIVGGDTTSWDARLAISVTVLGTAATPILRSGGRPGDRLFVSGPLGRSGPTEHHLSFAPRLELGQRLAAGVDGFRATAMLDLSDGLSSDVRHLAAASGCGVLLDAALIPRRDGATLDEALGDGEDFELLVAGRGDAVPDELIAVGHLTDRPNAIEIRVGDSVVALPARGWSHAIGSD